MCLKRLIQIVCKNELFRQKKNQKHASIKDLRSMILRIDILDYPRQDAVFIKDEGPADSTHDGLAVHFLLAPGSECLKHLGRGIRQKSERKIVLLTELPVRSRTVLAYPDDIVSLGDKRIIIVPDAARFCRTSACIILRIEIHNGLLSHEVLGADLFAVLVHDLEIRHSVSNLQHTIKFKFIKILFHRDICKSRSKLVRSSGHKFGHLRFLC